MKSFLWITRKLNQKVVSVVEGLFVALISSIILSVMGLAGFTCSLGFKIIDAINELTNAVKEKTQSKDCVEEENNRFIDSDKAEK